MNNVAFVIQLVLGVLFIGAGLIKCNPKKTSKNFERFGFPNWFKPVSGIIEIGSGILVLSGIVYPVAAAWGGSFILLTMLGAIYSQLKVGDSFREIVVPVFILGLSLLILILNWRYLFVF
ncbi:MAG: DoxX family protein [Carnobacterium sp.]|uniref:DoxX family protein n=1 Tax=Carnobacterium sp. TaxID=48221 RepID=UPI003C7661C1